MKELGGFPVNMEFTPIPNLFFSSLMPQISDISELKVTLYIFAVVHKKKGYPRFTTYNELASDASLMKGLTATDKSPEEALRTALEMAVKRGTVLRLALNKEGAQEDVYFINTDSDRRAIAKIQSGELVLSGLKARATSEVLTEEMPDIFSLYEQNIGMLTPLVAEDLRDAEKEYPVDWIKDAIKEAAALNKRNWRYIERILENWSAKGKVDGAYRGHIKKTDPDKYIKGKYGHVVRR